MTPRLSVSQITTLRSSFAADVEAYTAAGFDGIGVWELKLAAGGDAEALEALESSGLESAAAIPTIPSILPLPLLAGPEDPARRVDAYCRSLERLAPFRPSGVVCLTGTAGGLDAEVARTTVVDGLRTVAAEAQRLGLRIGLEPYQRDGGREWSIVHTIPEAVALLRDAGNPPALGIQFDLWHLWNTPTLFEDIERECGRFVGVHVSDVRRPTRAWADRVLPGDGVADVPGILRALDDAGWTGLYDIEIFSDDGTFGSALEDSLWAAPPEHVLRRARERFHAVWRSSLATTPSDPGPPPAAPRRQTVKESR